MNKLILYTLCLIFVGCTSSRHSRNEVEMDPFAPKLKQKIREFIHYVDSIYPYHKDKMFYAINAKNLNDTNFVTIRTEYYYNPELYQIKGYTFLDSNLIVFEDAPGPIYLRNFESLDIQFFVPIYLIDTVKLIKFQDSIPGYQDGRKGIGDYEPLMYDFQLIGRDSLVLIFSGRW